MQAFNFNKRYKEVVDFNLQAGNVFHPGNTFEFWKAVQNQAKLVVEELNEVVEAIEANDNVELLDGLIDTHVTLAFMTELIFQAGFDVDKAFDLVNKNNSTKIFKSYTAAKETMEAYEDKGIEGMHIEEVVVSGVPYYTVRDANNKIRKPLDFVSVNIENCVLKE